MAKDTNKPLTKQELKDLQKKQPGSSPYLPGKAPFKKAKKNKGKKGDPEAEYSRPLKGAPPGHNIAKDYFTEDNDNPV